MQQHQHNGAPPRRGRCQLCSKNHLLKRCPEFRWMLPKERYEVAKNLNVCLNCLTDWHQLDDYHSSNRCSVCSRLHHTMFHHEDVHVNSPPGLKRFSAKLQQMISDGTLAKLYELISGNQEVQITPASQNPIAIRKVMAAQKAKDVREVAIAPISKLRRFTMENKPAIHPHGTDCQVILPVVLCELAAGDQKISLTPLTQVFATHTCYLSRSSISTSGQNGSNIFHLGFSKSSLRRKHGGKIWFSSISFKLKSLHQLKTKCCLFC
ncbi:uncharacterized protein LOC142242403 [Haematobia irritans]|uniref:uncharacterized protein LOC142242403 n=1 Tax=Haematobia irritans TaxID=7368 RepID=UPI003F503047